MLFNSYMELIDSYLNEYKVYSLEDITFSNSEEWSKVLEYCLQNKDKEPELYAIIANIYVYGYDGIMDYNMALKYLDEGIKKGSVNCIFEYGNMYAKGRVFPESHEKAFEYYMDASAKGLWRADFRIGVCYMVPRGVKRSVPKAREYFEKIAYLGFPQAQFNMWRCCESGDDINPIDTKSAFMWLELAANNSHPLAMFNLGKYYEEGYIVEKDIVKAVELYEKAAAQDSIDAELKIAEFYEKGIYYQQDYNKAFAIYSKWSANHSAKSKIREYNKNKCYHCGAFFSKETVKTLFGEKTICNICKKKLN